MKYKVFLSGLCILAYTSSPCFADDAVLSIEELRNLEKTELEAEKIRQEILDIAQKRNAKDYSSLFTFLTTIVAVAGGVTSFWKISSDITRQKQNDLYEREKESLRHLDASFIRSATDLGSDKPAIRAAAAVAMMSFLKPEASSLYDQTYLLLMANLKIEHNSELNKVLVQAFQRAANVMIERSSRSGLPISLSLDHANLQEIDLSNLDLSQVDMDKSKQESPSKLELDSADLTNSHLSNCQLQRVHAKNATFTNTDLSQSDMRESHLNQSRFHNTNFHDTELMNAELNEATFIKTKFQNAKLQSAKLQNATFTEVEFEGANVTAADFLSATFDLKSLKTLKRSIGWRNARFDEKILQRLENIT